MRLILRFLVGLVVILVIAWLGIWWYAEGRMESGVAHWADSVAAKGGQVSYDSLKRGTSPLTAAITLTNFNLTLPPTQRGSAMIALPSLALRIGLFNPLLLHTDLPNRITIGFNGFNSVLAFQSIAVAEQLNAQVLTQRQADPFRGGTLDAGGVDLLASSGSLLVLHADRLHSDFAYNRTAGAGAEAVGGAIALDGVALSPLLTHLLSIPFDGRIAHLGYGLNLSGPLPANTTAVFTQINNLPPADIADRQKLAAPLIHQWAVAGGHGALSFATTVGPTTASGGATVKFDANVQPEGTADLNADHLDALTASLLNAYPQAQGYVAQAEAVLSPYITSTAAGGQTLAMHAVYGGGQVSVNGKPAGAMPPVDWNALENPPPAQAPAPDNGQ